MEEVSGDDHGFSYGQPNIDIRDGPRCGRFRGEPTQWNAVVTQE
jgi:hypothetical protein